MSRCQPVLRLVVSLVAIAQTQCAPAPERPEPATLTLTVSTPPTASTLSREPLQPIPLHVDVDPTKVALGKALFHDPRLSRDDSVSCATCHNLSTGGTDHRPRSVGIGGQVGSRNAPTVFNSGFNFKQFWDGRANTLEEQIDGPITNPAEMDSTWPEIVKQLNGSDTYVSLFAATYPDGVTSTNIKDALATFERSLATPNARFDRFLRGETSALTKEEQDGYRLFKSYGCVSCHQGMNVGGNMLQRFGVMADYTASLADPSTADLGRFKVTGDEQDRYVFKVPSLRNVAVTAPYFHDGSAATLPAAVNVMGRYQLGRVLSPTEIDLIVAFLGTLTGEYEGRTLE